MWHVREVKLDAQLSLFKCFIIRSYPPDVTTVNIHLALFHSQVILGFLQLLSPSFPSSLTWTGCRSLIFLESWDLSTSPRLSGGELSLCALPWTEKRQNISALSSDGLHCPWSLVANGQLSFKLNAGHEYRQQRTEEGKHGHEAHISET